MLVLQQRFGFNKVLNCFCQEIIMAKLRLKKSKTLTLILKPFINESFGNNYYV